LGRANASRIFHSLTPSEHLHHAQTGYQTVSSLIEAGEVCEARIAASCALTNLAHCNGADPLVAPLLQAFVQLLEQNNMPGQAAAFRATEQTWTYQPLVVDVDFARSVWGT
jgi:hypothetical protein